MNDLWTIVSGMGEGLNSAVKNVGALRQMGIEEEKLNLARAAGARESRKLAMEEETHGEQMKKAKSMNELLDADQTISRLTKDPHEAAFIKEQGFAMGIIDPKTNMVRREDAMAFGKETITNPTFMVKMNRFKIANLEREIQTADPETRVDLEGKLKQAQNMDPQLLQLRIHQEQENVKREIAQMSHEIEQKKISLEEAKQAITAKSASAYSNYMNALAGQIGEAIKQGKLNTVEINAAKSWATAHGEATKNALNKALEMGDPGNVEKFVDEYMRIWGKSNPMPQVLIDKKVFGTAGQPEALNPQAYQNKEAFAAALRAAHPGASEAAINSKVKEAEAAGLFKKPQVYKDLNDKEKGTPAIMSPAFDYVPEGGIEQIKGEHPAEAAIKKALGGVLKIGTSSWNIK